VRVPSYSPGNVTPTILQVTLGGFCCQARPVESGRGTDAHAGAKGQGARQLRRRATIVIPKPHCIRSFGRINTRTPRSFPLRSLEGPARTGDKELDHEHPWLAMELLLARRVPTPVPILVSGSLRRLRSDSV
jgi:hypothetical protein